MDLLSSLACFKSIPDSDVVDSLDCATTTALTIAVVPIPIAFGWKSTLTSEPSIYAENVPKPLTLV